MAQKIFLKFQFPLCLSKVLFDISKLKLSPSVTCHGLKMGTDGLTINHTETQTFIQYWQKEFDILLCLSIIKTRDSFEICSS